MSDIVVVSLLQMLTPEKVEGYLTALEAFGVTSAKGMIVRAALVAAYRKLAPNLRLPQLRSDSQETRIRKLEEMFNTLAEELSSPGANESVQADNARDPAYEDFLSEAIDASMRAAVDGKANLLGRLAAKRASVSTETMDDLLYRGALRIADDTSMGQLMALVAVFLVANTPYPRLTNDAALVWQELDRKYADALEKARNTFWTETDLDYLASIGALRHMPRENAAGMAPGSRLESELQAGQYLGPGTNQGPMTRFRSLTAELDVRHYQAKGGGKPSLRSYEATPVGKQLAATMLEGMANK